MVDAPDWFVYAFDLLIFAVIVGGLVFLKAWWNARNVKGKMMAEIWEPNGSVKRVLVKPDSTGATVTVDNLVYRLPKDLGEKELAGLRAEGKPVSSNTYPRRRWMEYPNKPLTPIFVRIESWERDNPEPIRPFYGRVDDKGMFIDSQLTVTGKEWQAQKSVIQATGIAMNVEERAAREKEWQRAMANLPNKWVMYLGLGIIAILAVVSLYM